MQLGKKQLAVATLLTGALMGAILLVNVPNAYADTIGIDSTAGMSTWAASPSAVNFARLKAASSGALSSISLYAASISGSVAGGVGIYADSAGSPGALLAQGTATLVNGVNTFSSLSASVSIVSGTNYWLALRMAGGQFYYGGSGLRGWASTASTCCAMPTSISVTGTAQSSLAIYGTYSVGPDFTITASQASLNIAAGSTASSTLSLTALGGFSGTVTLGVTSGCPSGVTCTVTPNSVSTFPATATLSVPTLITTTGTYSVVVTATNGTLTHTVSVSVNVAGPTSYAFNVRPGATQIVVTVSWSGTASAAVTIAGPNGSPTLSESAGIIYDRTSIVVSGSTTTTASIHRVTFTIAAPISAQAWTLLLSFSGTGNYNVTIEVS